MLRSLLRLWPVRVLLICLLYYVTGRLGLLLALPPGYASLVWPPFGISIAALLLFGVTLWPGVFLGALLVNLRDLESISHLATPVFVGAGNTLAVVMAVLLIRKVLQFPKRFYPEKDVILYLAIAGPLAALVSATNGIGVLYLGNIVSANNLFINWLHWFVGDATGGLIFAPLALMFSTQSRQYWLKSITKVLLPVCLAFALILSASHYLGKAEHEKNVAEFNTKAEFTYGILAEDFRANMDILISLQTFFQSSQNVTNQEFIKFANTQRIRHPEIKALAWIPIDHPKPASFKIAFIEPVQNNENMIGYDLGTHPEQSALLQKAITTDQVISSRPMVLSTLNIESQGILFLLAIGQPDGILVQMLSLDGVLKDLTNILNDTSYRVVIEDVTDSQRIVVADSWQAPTNDSQRFNPELRWNSKLKVGDRMWEISIQQDPGLRKNSIFSSAVFLLVALAFVFLICSLLLTIANRIITVEEIVDEKTQHLIDLNVQLKKASETKSEFLANMSHEIRTPLNVIVGMSDLMEETQLTEDQRHYLDISKKAGHNLLTIINDILDISKIEAGLVTLEKTEVDLHEVVTEVCDMFQPKALEKNLDLSVYLSDDTHSIFQGDPTRIRQILSNLISNSIKFTQEGSIRVDVMKNHESRLPGNIIFHVSDTGIGIPPEKISQLFQPFTQADSTITRKFGGTGLGLSISKRLAKMMDGDITVESQLHRGSRFSFTLNLPWVRDIDGSEVSIPVTEVPGKVAEKTQSGAQTMLNILIVDDTDDNRLLIKAYLKKTPHNLFEAANGRQALDMTHSHSFDLILMDMQMPVMDGFTATQKIRQWEREHQKKPATIWALTAYALKNEIDRSLNAGCNLHLVKPLRKVDLLNHISKLIEENEPLG